MTQGDKPILEALVWLVADGLDGLEHVDATPPEVPDQHELQTIEELAGGEAPPYRFWSNLDYKPLRWIPAEEWEQRPAGAAESQAWLRFHPTATYSDPIVDAGRVLIAVDTFQWPAAVHAHAGGSLQHIAPSLDLACSFHHLRPGDEWLLIDAHSPVAADGLVGGQASIWGQDGALLASGGQQMLCRRLPPEP